MSDHTMVPAMLEQLAALSRKRRAEQGLSLRAAAREIGIGETALFHLEKGSESRLPTVIAVSRWVFDEDFWARAFAAYASRTPPFDKD